LNDEEKKKFREAQMLDLRGKEYLPVAARVFLARQDHPDWQIVTKVLSKGSGLDDSYHVYAVVYDASGNPLASAHKRVRTEGKGPAAQFPVETAETGAIGRALALCGYGTLSGDLDEGEQISDAPVGKKDRTWR
jgi:hypothetical protein